MHLLLFKISFIEPIHAFHLTACHKVENLSSIKHISIIVQLILMLAILVNGMIFTHAHRSFSGELITHAHPYSSDLDSPLDPGHFHSTQEFEWIDLLSFSAFTWLVILAAKFIIFQVFVNRRFRRISFKASNQFFEKNHGRAPPFYLEF